MKQQNKAYIYALTAVLLWSITASAFKISLRFVNHIQLLFFASLASLIALFAIVVMRGKLYELKTLSKKQLVQIGNFSIPWNYLLVYPQIWDIFINRGFEQ